MNLKITRQRNIYFAFSAFMVALAIGAMIFKGFNLGIDFKGGQLLQLKFEKAINKDELNKTLDGIAIEIPQLKSNSRKLQYSEGNTIIIRTQEVTEAQKVKILNDLKAKEGNFEVVKADKVGATIGKELTNSAGIALLFGSILIVFYITIRFELIYAVAAIIALLHDVFITIVMVCLLGLEIDTPFIAAILTILGYSINDTIVVFDRIRENDAKLKNKMDFIDIIDLSINQVFWRSLFTSITTLFSILALLILGGASLRTFNFALFVGVFYGAYSSIFLASPILYLLRKYKRKPKDVTGEAIQMGPRGLEEDSAEKVLL
ncbi:MAG: protein translocase subunit SecF [Leptotrichiaceae bacterium]